ncbi:MAG: NUDIX hydrolase [Chloroflexi bacterium]|nr:NUDIX hydrolase [Chloroflexota bacterium]
MPHQILSRETVYQAHAFDIERLHVCLPDGRERDYDLVRHNDSVTIVPLDADGNIWFVSQYRMGCECEMLELPAGVMHDSEEPGSCAAREVREEIGMAADKLTYLGSAYLAPGYSSENNHIFLAEDLSESPLDMDDDEFLQGLKIHAKKAYEMAETGQILDSKTLAALLLARKHIFG